MTNGGCHVTESQDQIANLLASFADLGSEELKIGVEQGLYSEQQRPLVELELRRRLIVGRGHGDEIGAEKDARYAVDLIETARQRRARRIFAGRETRGHPVRRIPATLWLGLCGRYDRRRRVFQLMSSSFGSLIGHQRTGI